jgi:hypothetical protein
MLEIRSDRLLDGVADQSNADAVVLVDNGAIVAVDTRADTRWDTEVVDLGDVTLLSGLIDSHSHLMVPPTICVWGSRYEHLGAGAVLRDDRAKCGICGQLNRLLGSCHLDHLKPGDLAITRGWVVEGDDRVCAFGLSRARM